MGSAPPDSGRSGQRKSPWASILLEAVGWYGTLAILSAYFFVSLGVLDGEGLVYQILNFSGAVGVVLISLKKKAHQPAVLNMIWAVIALTAIGRVVL